MTYTQVHEQHASSQLFALPATVLRHRQPLPRRLCRRGRGGRGGDGGGMAGMWPYMCAYMQLARVPTPK